MGLVVSKSGPRSDRWEVKVGDSLPGFKVKEVRTDALALTAEGREFLLPLYAGGPTATGGALRTDVPGRRPQPPRPLRHRRREGGAAGGRRLIGFACASANPGTCHAPAARLRPRYLPGRR